MLDSLSAFDTHCHLQFPDFDTDREEVLARMKEQKIGAVVVGTDLASSEAAVELARQHDFLWAAVGLHPNDNLDEPFDVPAFEALAADPKVVGIGECGLDYYTRNRCGIDADSRGQGLSSAAKELQKDRFEQHVELARKVGKPLIIHCRPSQGSTDVHDDMAELLGNYSRELANNSLRVVMHFFTSTADIAERYLALGCHISFPCVVTFTDMYDDAVRAVPLDRLLIETDSPYAAPKSHRGKRNEPYYVVETIGRIAEIKAAPADEIAAATVRNSRMIFNL